MYGLNPVTVMFIAPMKKGDATEFTHQWAVKAIRMTKSLGYKVVELHGNSVTYDNVNKMIDTYKPRLFVTFSHGCPLSIQGQNECVITKRMGVEELIRLPNMADIIEPLKTSCPGICNIESNPCDDLCWKDTNICKLKGSIVYAVACHSSVKLGKYAVQYGVETYLGYRDLLLFPADSLGSQDMFGDMHLEILRHLLEGDTVGEAADAMNQMEDAYIKFYKTTKYMALPALWNHLHREVLGNQDATIY